jgi:Ca-activated chloride channel family protein
MKKNALPMAFAAALLFAAQACSDATGERAPVESDAISLHDSSPGEAAGDPYTPHPDASYADAPHDAAVEVGPPDVPGPEAASDGEEEEEPVVTNVCDLPIEEPQVLYLSADDSNSQASPIIARWMINNRTRVPWYAVRTYEFLNYYNLNYDPPPAGRVGVSAQMRPDPDEEGLYNMQIGVQSNILTMEERRSLNITFSLDTSGSMSGGPIERLKHVCRAIAANLRAGDIVSMVKWNTVQTVLLDSHAVSGPSDALLVGTIDGLVSDGSTDLNSGLVEAYRLAEANYSPDRLNRVVLISDGQANVGVTEEDLIAMHADDSEREGIYLVGVGTGDGYNDTLMDAVTDKGKGAYIFIDTREEAVKMFGERFLSSLEIAVMDVQVQLTLPPVLRMEIFYGEEISGNPKEVEPQHLAPNDAMIFQQTLRSCWEMTEEDAIRVLATYMDPVTRERRSDSLETDASSILAGAAWQLTKGYAVVQYAEALKKIDQAANLEEKRGICDRARTKVDQAAAELDDPELREISSLLETYCAFMAP